MEQNISVQSCNEVLLQITFSDDATIQIYKQGIVPDRTER